LDGEWYEASDSGLSETDANVLSLIGDEGLTRFTFDGLKRRLGVHPETLSRTLARLEDQGIIERQTDGYRVTSKARKLVDSQTLGTKESSVPLLQTLLPPEVPIKQIVLDLSGKWFGDLRWLGYAKNGESITLKWITEDGGIQVDATLSGGALNIDAKMLTENNINTALMASYQLIGYISRIYSRFGRIQHVTYFNFFGSDPILMWM
jgi:DNA-binding transcriptional ArsR family regulator